VVIVFGVQSGADWTWYFMGVTVPALLCAGWLAGRGPLGSPVARPPLRASILARPAVGAAVTALAAVALVGCWLIWQPLRSADAVVSSENAAGQGRLSAAFADARRAAAFDPLALQPLFLLSSLYQSAGDLTAARAQLVKAVRLQPDNSASWLQLGSFDLQNHQPRLALASLQRAYTLDPTVPATGITLQQAKSLLAAAG
jgi:tetratricopeptide (TPR) repeat protein